VEVAGVDCCGAVARRIDRGMAHTVALVDEGHAVSSRVDGVVGSCIGGPPSAEGICATIKGLSMSAVGPVVHL
jgi:hypothetical protein